MGVGGSADDVDDSRLGRMVVASRRLDGRPRPIASLLGFLLIVGAASVGKRPTGLKAGLGAPASKLLLEKRWVPGFSLLFLLFFSFVLLVTVGVAVVAFLLGAQVGPALHLC